MASNILPRDAGADFEPKEIERKEISEESRAINIKGPQATEAVEPPPEDGEEAPAPDSENSSVSSSGGDTSSDESPSDSLSDEIFSGESPGEEVPDDIQSRFHKNVVHNPDFEPLAEPDSTIVKTFSRWIVTEELHEDGTFQVIEEDLGDYQPAEKPQDKTPEEIREEVMAQARLEAEELRRKAQEDGYRDGYAKGEETVREELRTEMVPVFEELRNSIKSVLDYRGEILFEAEKEIFELAFLFSQKVLHSELRIRPEAVLDVVRHALKRAVGWGEATVKVHPEDYEFLEKHKLLLSDESEGVVVARIETNPGIVRGGCILESNFGEIDVRLEKQVEAVEQALRDALSEKIKEYEEAQAGKNEEAPAPEVEAQPAGEAETPAEDESVKPYQPKDLGSDGEEASDGDEAE